MAVAAVLALDLGITARIFGLVKALPDLSVQRPGWMPHIVLASYSDAVDVADVDAALSTATDWVRWPITVAGIGVFPGAPTASINLLVVPTPDIMGRHSVLHRALAAIPTHPAYQPGKWVPHVSLGQTDLVADSVEVLTTMWPGQMVGWAVSLDLVRTDTWELLSSRPLRDG